MDKKPHLKNFIILIGISILPIVFSLLIYHHFKIINQPSNSLHQVEGLIENKGITTKVNRPKSRRGFKTETEVFFIKLKNNDTIYSYFFRDENELLKKLSKFDINDKVLIYNEGFDRNSNTVNIIELQKGNEIMISANTFYSNNKIMLILFSIGLVVSLVVPIFKLRK